MFASEYDQYTNNKQVKKIIQKSNYEEIKAKREIPIPDFESIPKEVREECRLISEEMAYTLLFKLVQTLDPIDRTVIQYSFGLPKQYTRWTYYPQLSRKEIAKMVDRTPLEVMRIREDAVKALFRGLIGDRIDE